MIKLKRLKELECVKNMRANKAKKETRLDKAALSTLAARKHEAGERRTSTDTNTLRANMSIPNLIIYHPLKRQHKTNHIQSLIIFPRQYHLVFLNQNVCILFFKFCYYQICRITIEENNSTL